MVILIARSMSLFMNYTWSYFYLWVGDRSSCRRSLRFQIWFQRMCWWAPSLCCVYNLLQANLLLHMPMINDLSLIHLPEEHRNGSINVLLQDSKSCYGESSSVDLLRATGPALKGNRYEGVEAVLCQSHKWVPLSSFAGFSCWQRSNPK